MSTRPERTLTHLDHARLSRFATDAEGLDDVLAQSELVDSRAVRPDVVTMNSRVRLGDAGNGSRAIREPAPAADADAATAQELTLCYPEDAQATDGRVSVLSPIGTALLGARAGATVRWTTPDGRDRAARIVDLVYQPEASGDYLR